VRKPRKWKLGLLAAVVLLIPLWFGNVNFVDGQSPELRPTRDIFSPAHSSIFEAVSHFVGHRPKPSQPIQFNHKVHVDAVQLECADCHISVARGPVASIPDIRTCWNCHENTLVDHAEIKKLKAYHDKGEDVPWQRVWGWVEESHVRFNHAPHIREQIDCVTCHGDVSKMTVATRAVEHTMGFCIDCHRQKGAPDDCVTCHF
jgi:hypothetical protein